MKAIDVKPKKWSNITVLFDNGHYSAIWGNYENSTKPTLGVRWNGDSNLGYPVACGNPVWYCEPRELTHSTLQGLQQWLLKTLNNPNLTIEDRLVYEHYSANLVNAMKEFLDL